MPEPIIGVLPGFSSGTMALEASYLEAIRVSGGTPRILPFPARPEEVPYHCTGITGLVIPGGPGMTLGMVGELPPDLPPADPIRVDSEQLYLDYLQPSGIPILGICYGMQLLNARAGGTLCGDIADAGPCWINHSQTHGATAHELLATPQTRAAELFKAGTLVNTHHRQAIIEPGAGYTVTAIAPDGVPEIIEHNLHPWIGIQFHPERMGEQGLPVFRYLVAEAARYGSISESG